MCRLFKEVTGYSISEYINIHRIQKASHYLENTDLSISEITGLIGYGSMTHFEKNLQNLYECISSEIPEERKSSCSFRPSDQSVIRFQDPIHPLF